MRVLRRGTGKKIEQANLTCTECDARLLVDKSDCRYSGGDMREPGFYSVACPECGSGLIVAEDGFTKRPCAMVDFEGGCGCLNGCKSPNCTRV
jgi:DNA-directed RNA polymerase subunit RPC12/RpoP